MISSWDRRWLRSRCSGWPCRLACGGTYFGGDDTQAKQALSAAPRERRGRLAIEAFGHAYLGLLLGVIAVAAGLESGAHHPFDPLVLGHAVALGGGVALYLASDAWFRRRLRIGRPGLRVLAAIPALASIALGLWVAVAQVAALVVIFAVLFSLESRRRNVSMESLHER